MGFYGRCAHIFAIEVHKKTEPVAPPCSLRNEQCSLTPDMVTASQGVKCELKYVIHTSRV
jgi:hypothetical protein